MPSVILHTGSPVWPGPCSYSPSFSSEIPPMCEPPGRLTSSCRNIKELPETWVKDVYDLHLCFICSNTCKKMTYYESFHTLKAKTKRKRERFLNYNIGVVFSTFWKQSDHQKLLTWRTCITILTLLNVGLEVLILFGCRVCETSCLRDFNCSTE